MRVAMTGANGFLGTHLSRALVAAGHGVASIGGDVRHQTTFETAEPADVLVHLAAVSRPAQSVSDPRGTWAVNAEGTLNALEWCRGGGAQRMVFISTAHVYGVPRVERVDESHPRVPSTPYGASKLAAEAMVDAYRTSYGLATCIIRPFNIYGPGQSTGFLVPDILHQLLAGHAPRLGDPRPVRDFTYVDDAVELVRLVAESSVSGEVFNLGSGKGHAVRDVVDAAVKASGLSVEPFYDPARFRPNDTPVLIVDNRHAMKVLGWHPRVELVDGIARTWAALRST